VLNVSEHRKRRSVEKLGVEAAVNHRHDRLHRVVVLADAVEDGVLAHAAMQKIGLDQSLRLLDLAAMARKVAAFGALVEEFERADVGAHIAFGRRHDTGIPAHDVVTGKQDLPALERKAQMVRGVAGREHRLERPAIALEAV